MIWAITPSVDEVTPPPRMDVKVTQAFEGGLTALGILIVLLIVISMFLVVIRERSPGRARHLR